MKSVELARLILDEIGMQRDVYTSSSVSMVSEEQEFRSVTVDGDGIDLIKVAEKILEAQAKQAAKDFSFNPPQI